LLKPIEIFLKPAGDIISWEDVKMFRRMQDRQSPQAQAQPQLQSQATIKRYQMRQKLVSIGDDFYIENEQGQRVFKVDGKAARIADTLIFRDTHGNKLATIKEKIMRVKDTMEIEAPTGGTLAVVKKAMITPLRERWAVKIGNGPDLEVQGNLTDHEYTIRNDRNVVAEISKKWFRARDTYGVTIQPGQNDILILAVTVAVEIMAG
jgi:uncharacterized protein YxjI